MPTWKATAPSWYHALGLVLFVYVPGSPAMILNMWKNRKGAMQKRARASKRA